MASEQHTYFVRASWDDEASVWISESDIPGLVIEADDLAQFEQLMAQLAPEMLADNTDTQGTSVTVNFRVDQRRELQVV